MLFRAFSRITFLRGVSIAMVLTLLSLTVGEASTAQALDATSTRPDPGPDREAEGFRQPGPRPELARSIGAFASRDPEASFTYFNCCVDSFATRPGASVPGYARTALRQLGLSSNDRTPELLAPMTDEPKLGQNLDANLNRKVPLPPETFAGRAPNPRTAEEDVQGEDPGTGRPLDENRVDPALVLEPRDSSYRPPPARETRKGTLAAKPVLLGFLAENADVFEIGTKDLGRGLPSLQQVDFTEGRYFRKATFAQTLRGLPVLDGKTLVFYDVNWNVMNISRTVFTPDKLAVADGSKISRGRAEEIARRALVGATGERGGELKLVEAVKGVDVIRRATVWDVKLVIPAVSDFTVRIDGRDGRVLNVDDNVLAATYDAEVRRWAYGGGRFDEPVQMNSTVPTRDNDTLVHDMFNLVNDERGGEGTQTCTKTPENTRWRSEAYGTTSGENYVRGTVRTDRAFDLWSPAAASGTFGETNAYFWAREYMRWNKQALNELGVLAADPEDRPALNIVLNGCVDDFYSSSYDLTTDGNVAETGAKITLREDCRVTNPSCDPGSTDSSGSFVTCEDGGCYASPSVLHHELNHFILSSYFGVSSALDCANSRQGRFLHEGAFGSTIPHMFWQFWYGVGYNPDTSKLFTASSTRGRIHADEASRLQGSNFSCPNFDNPDEDGNLGQQPYEAGRAVGQPMWEFVHGKKADGNTITNTARFLTDTDALENYYWAVDLVDGSTYKDRVEMAVRVMEIVDKYTTGVTPKIQQDWCSIWDHHSWKKRMNRPGIRGGS